MVVLLLKSYPIQGRSYVGPPPQSPEPGFGEKYWSLSAFPSHSFQSGDGTFLTAIFGQIFAYSAAALNLQPLAGRRLLRERAASGGCRPLFGALLSNFLDNLLV